MIWWLSRPLPDGVLPMTLGATSDHAERAWAVLKSARVCAGVWDHKRDADAVYDLMIIIRQSKENSRDLLAQTLG